MLVEGHLGEEMKRAIQAGKGTIGSGRWCHRAVSGGLMGLDLLHGLEFLSALVTNEGLGYEVCLVLSFDVPLKGGEGGVVHIADRTLESRLRWEINTER